VPRKTDPELLRLRQENKAQRRENETQRRLIQDLSKQIELLTQQITLLQGQLQESVAGNSDLKNKLDDLLFQLKNLTRQVHGPTTEHHNPRQAASSSPEDTDEDQHDSSITDRLKDKATKEKRPRNHKKHIKEQNLPEKEVFHPVKPEELNCIHCQVETVLMTYLETSQIERETGSLVRHKHKQEVRSCPRCKTYVVTAEKPCPPIPGSYAGPCLLSGVIVDKFADALPNYRQTKRFAREKATIPRSTQCDWMIASSITIEPLYELLKREVLSSKVVQTDDTWVKIQDRRLKGKTRKGKITSYVGDKRHPLNFFSFSPNLSFDKNKEDLKDFKGNVQADAANGFDELFGEGSGRTELGCNAHSRRKYWQCAEDEAYEMICGEILEIYRQLYKIEKDIRDKESAQRLDARQQKSKPLIAKLHATILSLKDSLNPTNPLMKAVAYTLNHWDALVRFIEDPDFEIDNNACERAIKSWVLVRKNILFVGSDAGGKAAAIHLSFIASCNRLGIDPLEYLTDVYTRINSMKTSELDQLLPDRWARNRASKPPP
jgi:transposase